MEVYAVTGSPPEIQAYALAKYSRSSQALRESIDELSIQRAEQFLNTFYFQYGHRSIADLAHIVLAIEGVSILAAFHISDEPLWDGQSRSSRYQDFRASGFYFPPALDDPREKGIYGQALDSLLDCYTHLASELTDVLMAVQPCPDDMTPANHRRALRARAFDVARYFLPLATLTSIGQITSARVLEQQISRLTAHPISELREIADAMRRACQVPAYNFVEGRLEACWAALDLNQEDISQQVQMLTSAGILGVSAAPTLVKYTTPDLYGSRTIQQARELFGPRLRNFQAPPDLATIVKLVAPETDPLDAYVSTLLYLVDDEGHSYQQLQEFAHTLSERERLELFVKSADNRGQHDDFLRLHRLGYLFCFDLLADFGALRDLHRHRRCVQIIPDLKLHLGFEDPSTIFEAALGEDGADLARQKGLVDLFTTVMEQAIESAQRFPRPEYAVYLLPLGARQRALFKMDLAEAGYVAELRSGVGGHFSYRRIAYDMYRQLCERYPYLAGFIRATNPHEVIDLLRR